jgi:hypothetical protein
MPLYNTAQTEPGTSNLIDTRPKNTGQEVIAFGQRYITTLTGVAENALGDVSKWREVLAANPSMLPFSLPPTLQKDIDNLNNTIAFTGLKIPSLDILETDLKKALGDLANPVLSDVEKAVLPTLKKGLEDIKQLEWLL